MGIAYNLPGVFETKAHEQAYGQATNSLRLLDFLERVQDAKLREILITIYHEYDDIWPVAKGSTANHQAWEGGLRDHLASMCRIACGYYQTDRALMGPLPFSFDDVIVCIFCHDAEKLVKNWDKNDPRCGPYILKYQQGAVWEEVKKHVLAGWRERFGLKLTDQHMNALTYTHGEPENEYDKYKRVMGELAAFVGNVDRASARIYHSLQQGMG